MWQLSFSRQQGGERQENQFSKRAMLQLYNEVHNSKTKARVTL